MKILHLEASPGWGGQEMRILREGEGMRACGHEIIFGVMKGGLLIPQACKAGFTVYSLCFQKRHWAVCLIRLLWLIHRHKIDLINTHSSLDAWIGGIAGRISGRPIVRTRHLSTPIKKGWNSRVLYGWLADFVVTTCTSIIPMICQQSKKEATRCRSIPTGVDPLSIEKGLAASFDPTRSNLVHGIGIGSQDFLVGTACFMRSWKGIDDFLRAAHLLRGSLDIKWVIIGGGHEDEYRKKAKELLLQETVYFTGHLENPFPALRALNVFSLLSTAHEGVSQALLQAAYLGKPLITTRTGGLGEVCLDQQTGILVEPFSPTQVAKAVLRLKENRQLCIELGKRAQQFVKERFLLEQTIDQMERVYTEMNSKIGF